MPEEEKDGAGRAEHEDGERRPDDGGIGEEADTAVKKKRKKSKKEKKHKKEKKKRKSRSRSASPESKESEGRIYASLFGRKLSLQAGKWPRCPAFMQVLPHIHT